MPMFVFMTSSKGNDKPKSLLRSVRLKAYFIVSHVGLCCFVVCCISVRCPKAEGTPSRLKVYWKIMVSLPLGFS